MKKECLSFLVLTFFCWTIILSSCTANIEQSGILSKSEPSDFSNKDKDMTHDEWTNAEKNFVRLMPGEFPDLPTEIVSDLEKRKCTIPQTYGIDERHNVIKGEFKKKGQKDFALLCSRNKASSILIYWSSTTEKVSEIRKKKNRPYFQTIGGGKIDFSRTIEVADAKYIYGHYESYGGPKPPKITHHGINDIYSEKASTVLYFEGNKWSDLQGAD